MNGISPQLQNQITQFQQVQQQLQAVSGQKAQMETQKREIERTLEELSRSTGAVYKASGSLMIKVDDVAALKADLEESVELMDVRIGSLSRQETGLRERYQVLQESINSAMGRNQD
jgi:prefoldin beta subunit